MAVYYKLYSEGVAEAADMLKDLSKLISLHINAEVRSDVGMGDDSWACVEVVLKKLDKNAPLLRAMGFEKE